MNGNDYEQEAIRNFLMRRKLSPFEEFSPLRGDELSGPTYNPKNVFYPNPPDGMTWPQISPIVEEPIQEPTEPDIFSRYRQMAGEYPTMEGHDPGTLRKILSSIAGFASGYEGGPAEGMKTYEDVAYQPYRRKVQEWKSRMAPVEAEANLEAQIMRHRAELAQREEGKLLRQRQLEMLSPEYVSGERAHRLEVARIGAGESPEGREARAKRMADYTFGLSAPYRETPEEKYIRARELRMAPRFVPPTKPPTPPKYSVFARDRAMQMAEEEFADDPQYENVIKRDDKGYVQYVEPEEAYWGLGDVKPESVEEQRRIKKRIEARAKEIMEGWDEEAPESLGELGDWEEE